MAQRQKRVVARPFNFKSSKRRHVRQIVHRQRRDIIFNQPASGGWKFDPALLKSLSPAGSEADLARSQFWIKYEEIASDYDQRFVSRLENGVDISMLFAGLFSAVNTAFIIAMQSNIVVLNSSNATIANIVNAGGLVSSLGWTTALSYASLSTSLLAAFSSLLAKQWLAHFKATRSTHGTLPSRGVHRQRKFDAMQNSYFNTILDCIPVLLEASLLLFAISLLGITWYPYRDVAGVVLAAAGTGFTLYFVTFFAAMLSPDSPFQTLPSQLLKSLFQLWQLGSTFPSEFPKSAVDLSAQIAYWASHPNPNSKSIPLPLTNLSQEAPAVRWLLHISADPVVVTAVAKMVPEVDWPVDFDVDEFAKPLLETFKSCFKVQSNDHIAVSLLCSDPDRAYACSKALCHLYSEILYGEPGPDSELLSILTSLNLCFSSATNLHPQEHRFAFICALISSIIGDPASTTSISVPEAELSWVSHILPAFLHSTKHGWQIWVDLAASIIPKFALYEPMPSKVLADDWIMIALILGMRINSNDLVRVDKSSAIDIIREEVCAFIEPGPPRRQTIQKTSNNQVFVLALDLILRVLSVERDRGMITEGDLNSWIVDLYEGLTNGEDSSIVWESNLNGCAILKAMFQTVNLHSLLKGWTLRKSSKYVHNALKHIVESRDTEMARLVLPLWFDTTPSISSVADLGFDAIMLLLCCNNPQWCQVAFRSTIQALDPYYLSSWQHLLQRDQNKFIHLFDTLLQPLRIIDTDAIHTSSSTEDRFDMVGGYLRVVSTMADDPFFHTHLLAHGHLQQCMDIQFDTQVSEGARAKQDMLDEHPFLLLSVIASVGACSNPGCIEAATHPSTIIAENYLLERQTVMSALGYIQNASRYQLDANRITHIAEYIKLTRWPQQDVPLGFREAIEGRINQKYLSLDSALAQLLRALGFDITFPTSPTPDSE